MPGNAPRRDVLATLELLRHESRLCREMEDTLFAPNSRIHSFYTKEENLQEITNAEGTKIDPTASGAPGEILIALIAKAGSSASVELSLERRALRGLFGGLNRLGIAVAAGHACIHTIAMCEGRYFAAVWLRWKPYIKHRRDHGHGRERIYAPAESLVHEVAKAMLENLDSQENGHRYWQAIKDDSRPLSQYYSFHGFDETD